MLDYLAELELPTIVVLTKADKLSPNAANARADEIMKSLSLERDQTILFSAATGQGRDELAEAVASLVDAARPS
jgi:GTP-binding protein